MQCRQLRAATVLGMCGVPPQPYFVVIFERLVTKFSLISIFVIRANVIFFVDTGKYVECPIHIMYSYNTWKCFPMLMKPNRFGENIL
jgi:hypothetical protein